MNPKFRKIIFGSIPYDGYLLMGQSNAQGVAADSGAPTTYSSSFPGSYIYDSTAGFALLTLSNNEGNTSSTFGPEMSFGRNLSENVIVKYGASGTSLAVSWKPTVTYGTTLQAALTECDAALTGVPGGVAFKGALWVQGESDAQTLAHANAYQTNLTTLIALFRSRYKRPITFVVAKLNPDLDVGTYPYVTTIRTAQDAVATADANTFTVETVNLETFDGLHYDAPSNLAIGYAAAQALAERRNTVALPECLKNIAYSATSPAGVVSARETTPTALWISQDGLTAIVAGNTNKTAYQFSMTTPRDISTLVYANKSYAFTEGQLASDLRAVMLNPSGSKMWAAGNADDTVYQYTLTTPGDVTTAVYDNVSLDVSVENQINAMCWSNEGYSFYYVGQATDRIRQHNCTTPYDLATAGAEVGNLLISAQDTLPRGLWVSQDGIKCILLGDSNNTLYEYTMKEPYDITTGVHNSGADFSVNTYETQPAGLWLDPLNRILAHTGFNGDDINVYTL